jgi:dihydrofolate reductase
MAHFKNLTMGHPVVMGRKTWESIPQKYRPLPGRTNFVVTRQNSYSTEGAVVCSSFESALVQAGRAEGDEELFVIGGGELYAQALPLAKRLYLTLVDSDAVGDTFFPEYQEFTKVLDRVEKTNDALSYTFITLERP